MRAVVLLAVAAASISGVAVGAGCGASATPAAPATPCNEDPFQCGAGKTCWPQQCTCPSGTGCSPTDCTPQFECAGSAGKQPGDACQLQIGQVTCGDLQTCVALAGSGAPGVCRVYCDPGDPRRGCASGFGCVQLGVGSSSAVENVCLPAPSAEDASLSVDAPSSDDAGAYDPDALPIQPDAMADSGQHTM
ncbi:MAG TPA: hypothetical protein VIF15_19500 [Polyangiaceae bacterium]|jgi:hypothetical protein